MVPAITVRGTMIATIRAEPARAQVARAIETTDLRHGVARIGSTPRKAASAAVGVQLDATIVRAGTTTAGGMATGATAASVPLPAVVPAPAGSTDPAPAEATANATTAVDRMVRAAPGTTAAVATGPTNTTDAAAAPLTPVAGETTRGREPIAVSAAGAVAATTAVKDARAAIAATAVHVRNATVRTAAPSATAGAIPPTATTTAAVKTAPATAQTTADTAEARDGAQFPFGRRRLPRRVSEQQRRDRPTP